MGVFFGTDGIRGKVNIELTFEMAKKIGNALSCFKCNPKIIIGSDTRISNTYLTMGVSGGAVAGGARVTDIGVAPTAAIAYITKESKADFGVVISASHNSGEYNGIKIFGGDGYKLSDKDEETIERLFLREKVNDYPDIGRYEQDFGLLKLYKRHLISISENRFSGMTVALDCAYGAAYKVAPEIFRSLGARVIAFNSREKGVKINENCGALYPEKFGKKVLKYGADFGFSFDGDADRLIAVDEKGEVIDGDKILLIFTKYLKNKNMLPHDTVVGTSHTNLAVEEELAKIGVSLIRADIGDKYVLSKMLEKNLALGGEQSGHIIIKKHTTTGDGILSAIMLANIVKNSNRKLSSLANVKLYPQINRNVVVKDKFRIMNNDELNKENARLNAYLGGNGRIMIRASGTEPKIRVMVESPNSEENGRIADDIVGLIEKINGEV